MFSKRQIFASVLILVFSALLISGCAASASSSAELDGTAWQLVTINGNAPVPGTQPTARFAEGEVTGSAGCNSYFGSFEVKGSKLTVGALGMTEMYCMEPEGAMDQETAYLSQLGDAESFTIAGETLEITTKSGDVLVFSAMEMEVSELPVNPDESVSSGAPLFDTRPADMTLDPAGILDGTAWRLAVISDIMAIPGSEVTLFFEGSDVSGSAGCNSYGGTYTSEAEGVVAFGPLFQTEMYCMEPEGVMDQESYYLSLLSGAESYGMLNGQLIIVGTNGVWLTFDPYASSGALDLPAIDLAQSPLDGTAWIVEQVDGQPALERQQASMAFAGGTLHGDTGCNSFSIEYSVGEGGSLEVTQIIGSPEICEEDITNQEMRIFKVLEGLSSYVLDGDTLTLSGSTGSLVLRTQQ